MLYPSLAIISIVFLVSFFVGFLPKFFKENSLTFRFVIAVALGVMLGIASLHLLPEVYEAGEEGGVAFLVSLLFFVVLLWLTHSHEHGDTHDHHAHAPVKLSTMFLGQAVHAVTDGVAITLAFATSNVAGMVVSLAIAVHHVPMMSGIAERYRKYFSSNKLILLSSLSSACMLLGMLLLQYLSIFIIPGVMMAIAAASFIFVALSDFVIHLNEDKKGLAKTIIIVGAILGSLIAYSAEEFVHKIEDQNQKEVIYL